MGGDFPLTNRYEKFSDKDRERLNNGKKIFWH